MGERPDEIRWRRVKQFGGVLPRASAAKVPQIPGG